MKRHSPTPEEAMAKAARSSKRAARRAAKRAESLKETPKLGEALTDGRISGEHADAAGAALAELEGAERKALAKRIDALTDSASTSTAEEFARQVRAEAERLAGDKGESKFERQRKAIRLWHRADPLTGMGKIWMSLDPLSYTKFVNRNDGRVAALFAERVPDGCPHDPVEKQAYLRALAFLADLDGDGPAMGRPEVVVVLDTRTLDDDGFPATDWGVPVELPRPVLEDLLPRAVVHPVVVAGGVVVHAPGRLDLGRTTRLANAAQRRVLRALYPTCAVPDCEMRFDHCKVHHVVWWRHGGRTDLDNLLPVCVGHHGAIHDRGWDFKLQPDRTLTITIPDGEVMTCGPPRRC